MRLMLWRTILPGYIALTLLLSKLSCLCWVGWRQGGSVRLLVGTLLAGSLRWLLLLLNLGGTLTLRLTWRSHVLLLRLARRRAVLLLVLSIRSVLLLGRRILADDLPLRERLTICSIQLLRGLTLVAPDRVGGYKCLRLGTDRGEDTFLGEPLAV